MVVSLEQEPVAPTPECAALDARRQSASEVVRPAVFVSQASESDKSKRRRE